MLNKPTDTVHVLRNAPLSRTGKVIVYDVHDINDVQATSGDTGGDHDWTFCGTERTTLQVSN